MAKKKTTEVVENKEVTEVTEATELEDAVKVVEKKRVKTKEEICEFYWIRDDEIIWPNCDLTKYNLKPEETDVLCEWAAQNMKVNVDNIHFDMYRCSPEVKAIIEKYWITAKDVVSDWGLAELSDEEKDIICWYYNELVTKSI